MSIAPKRLSRHAVPVIMVVVTALVISALLLGGYNTTGWNTGNPVVKAAVIRVVHINPTPHGSVKVVLGVPAEADADSAVASSMGSGLATLGRDTQLLLNLQAPPAN